MPAQEQRRFDALYNRNAARIASGLSRYNADGPAMLRTAQALIARSPDEPVKDCEVQISDRTSGHE
jgi:hypothetical protein